MTSHYSLILLPKAWVCVILISHLLLTIVELEHFFFSWCPQSSGGEVHIVLLSNSNLTSSVVNQEEIQYNR